MTAYTAFASQTANAPHQRAAKWSGSDLHKKARSFASPLDVIVSADTLLIE